MTLRQIASLTSGDIFDIWKALSSLAKEVIRLKEEVESSKNKKAFDENELNPHPDDVLNVPKLKWVNNNLSHALSLTEQIGE